MPVYLPGVRALIMGPPGTGKTTSLSTISKLGFEVFAIFLDAKFSAATSKDTEIKWKYIAPAQADWSTLISAATNINKFDHETLQKLKGMDKSKYPQFLDVLQTCNDFKVGGRSYGDIAKWGTNKVLVIDPLTGLNSLSRKLTVGGKPVITQTDWGVMMQNLENFLDKLTMGLFCHFILIAHVDREIDEVMGGVKLMVSTLGRKLAPTIPGKFTDVVLATREGGNFYWSTADSRADLIGLNLPIQDKMPPDFKPMFDNWKLRGGQVIDYAPEGWQQMLEVEKEQEKVKNV